MPFPAIDEAPASSDLTEKKTTVKRILGQFVNKTRNFSHKQNVLIKL